MKTQTFSFFLLALLLVSCNRDDVDNWTNPEIDFNLEGIERPIQQYPTVDYSGMNQSEWAEREKEDSIKMQNFFSQNSKKFKKSKYPVRAAENIFQVIFNHNFIQDESYGMPGPGQVSYPMTIAELKNRVSIKRTSKNKCLIFYWYVGCGRNFNYSVLTFNEQGTEIIEIEPIETWSANAPC